ncbi:MAG: hypothetical protein A2504_14130 [Bdellovibrionales bacterium RIFOXYD12_FULL_39_22]|nr:MAG: hypothetical protein A2385_04565 [Bdellovibrionales bacterium RIFOXYB1_FULL_39_21]OFZ43421.1 MAG: hypothetical protein A2485_13080 [Bdellovibrionales bacterium RIFOXYC12_FULL_39_17]OFZ46964.1 MAG: hypothetical protein A2404_00140 [Bdellovibrionales bacterium RIFOXYC1_FULL_39_130]OFZ71491.1 MAG: hypothetical protein A2451_00120 [Bdellovibrionales bacterium RIFOXYC2_FULL_39_8]OFZ76161.1 MAG: hypothetical protein A2560_07390 [Bdellovibrionales bacterium RIFOXYD1_FULL_39_84]OFZ94396.1 MAG:
MKFHLVFLSLLGTIIMGNLCADTWLCKQVASIKLSTGLYNSCGLGVNSEESMARKLALKNAFDEFYALCNKSYDCKGHKLSFEPLRTDCEQQTDNNWKCYRGLQVDVSKEKDDSWSEDYAALEKSL